MYARQIWAHGIMYKDILRVLESYFDSATKFMIACTCARKHADVYAPVCNLTVPQLEWCIAQRMVCTQEHFAHACACGNFPAMDWLHKRGVHMYINRFNMSQDMLDWLQARGVHKYPGYTHVSVFNPKHVNLHIGRASVLWLCQYVTEHDDPIAKLKQYPHHIQMAVANVCHNTNNVEFIQYCYSLHVPSIHYPYNYSSCVHPDACHIVAMHHPDVWFADHNHRMHTRTAKLYPHKWPLERLCQYLTWDDDAEQYMDEVLYKCQRGNIAKLLPKCIRAVEWCIKNSLFFDITYATANIQTCDITYKIAKLAQRNGCQLYYYMNTQDIWRKLRKIHSYCPIALKRCSIMHLCSCAPGDVILQYIPRFTRSHLIVALQTGNIAALHYMVGLACDLGWSKCASYVQHVRGWVWIRENVPVYNYYAPVRMHVQPGAELKRAMAQDNVIGCVYVISSCGTYETT